MAENALDNGQLDQVAVNEVAQPQAEAEETETEATQGESQSTGESANSSTDSKTEDVESIDLDKLEAKLTEQETDNKATDESKDLSNDESQKQALKQKENKQSRGEARYQQLANENKNLREQLQAAQLHMEQDLANEIKIPTPPWRGGSSEKKPSGIEVEPGAEITQEQYQQHIEQVAQEMAAAQVSAYQLQVQDRLNRQQQVIALNDDINYLKNKYPELDQSNANYSYELDKLIGQIVENTIAVNPALVKSMVDGVMQLRQQSLQAGQSRANAELNQQRSQGALIPSASNTEPVDVNKLSLSQLEAKLGIVQ